jgi:hypothetical protein
VNVIVMLTCGGHKKRGRGPLFYDIDSASAVVDVHRYFETEANVVKTRGFPCHVVLLVVLVSLLEHLQLPCHFGVAARRKNKFIKINELLNFRRTWREPGWCCRRLFGCHQPLQWLCTAIPIATIAPGGAIRRPVISA